MTKAETPANGTRRIERRPYSRTGLNALKARVTLRGFRAIDRRTAGARELFEFRRELAVALGGEGELTPQQRKLVELAARASLYLDHVDHWLVEQRSLINARTRNLLPALIQRQALADHLVRVLEKLGLERKARPVPTLSEYLEQKYGRDGALSAAETAPGGGPGASARDDQDGAKGTTAAEPAARSTEAPSGLSERVSVTTHESRAEGGR